jgi:hypothetical protein
VLLATLKLGRGCSTRKKQGFVDQVLGGFVEKSVPPKDSGGGAGSYSDPVPWRLTEGKGRKSGKESPTRVAKASRKEKERQR